LLLRFIAHAWSVVAFAVCEALDAWLPVSDIKGGREGPNPLYVHYEKPDDPASLIPSTIPHPKHHDVRLRVALGIETLKSDIL
jgi:hypothetical protein